VALRPPCSALHTDGVAVRRAVCKAKYHFALLVYPDSGLWGPGRAKCHFALQTSRPPAAPPEGTPGEVSLFHWILDHVVDTPSKFSIVTHSLIVAFVLPEGAFPSKQLICASSSTALQGLHTGSERPRHALFITQRLGDKMYMRWHDAIQSAIAASCCSTNCASRYTCSMTCTGREPASRNMIKSVPSEGW